ncbi:tetratricopeptide repeat protein [Streptomyces sp. enrichment culture]|uniref:tetratricopeptide repeat protein n=1 Tax=Streptomyces sp. enrichment culture TaxID=1795815 RepID=UPI003F56CF60
MGEGELREGDFDALLRVLRSDGYLGLMERLSALDPEGALGFDLLASRVRLAVSREAARAGAEQWLRRAVPRDPRVLDVIRSYAGEPAPAMPGRVTPGREVQGRVTPGRDGPAVRNTVADSAAGNVVQAHTVEQVNFFTAPPDPALWLDAATVDPHALGAPHEVPYIRRDRDADLGPERRDGFLLITGAPLSGKTTTAWAHVRRLAPGTQVCVPPPGTDLRTLPERIAARKSPCVLWLDDLERYLEGLDGALLSRLIAMGVRTVATMTDAAYDEHRFGAPATARVLSRARVVELELEWSEDELARMADSGDPRLRKAVLFCDDLRLTRHLAVGPELWEEWRRAGRPSGNQPGHQLVRAVLDLARCGLTRRPRELVRAVYDRYAPEHAESFDAALAWAVQPRRGGAGLLVEKPAPRGLETHSYLLAEALTEERLPPVPYETWDLALAQGEHRVTSLATGYFKARAAAGDPEAMYRLARLTGDEEWLRKAADAGHTAAAADLGSALADRGDTREAIRYLEKAAEAGDARAMTRLGRLLQIQATTWLARAAAADDSEAYLYTQAFTVANPQAGFLLARLLEEEGREKEAAFWMRWAAHAGHPGAVEAVGGGADTVEG